MKTYILPLMLLCFSYSCQPVNKDQGQDPLAVRDTVQATPAAAPDIGQLRSKLFDYFSRHRSEEQFDTLDGSYQLYGGPAHYPPYMVTAGHLFHKKQVHALLYYSDEQGAGLFVYLKKDSQWQLLLADTSEKVSAGNALPELKDWNRDGTMDLCLYYAPPPGMSTIGKYALWLMHPDGQQLRYIRGFTEIESPEIVHDKITGSYYYHGAHSSEYRIDQDSAVKTKETWDKEAGD